MILINRYDYADDMPAAALEELQRMAKCSLMEKVADHMETDTPYRLQIRDEDFSFFDDDGSIKRRKMCVDLEPIPQYSVRFLTPEETYLSAENGRSIFQKLKNCLSYLFDDGDGKIVCERIK